jgi:hypothetical protein
MPESWALLNELVVHEPEVTALGKDGGFVMNRAVFEVENQPAGHAIATGDLDQITVSESVSRHRAQHQETVDQPLRVANDYRCRRYCYWLEERGAGYQNTE